MDYDIEFINTVAPTVEYDTDSQQEFELAYRLEDVAAEDIGGLVVYANEGKVAAVYDYENHVGWVA
jgi:hypothetical protein